MHNHWNVIEHCRWPTEIFWNHYHWALWETTMSWSMRACLWQSDCTTF
jgi:hypothetical protein